MLIKKELLAMKELYATDEMLDMALDNEPEEKKDHWGNRTVYKYGTFLLFDKNEKYLKIAIFLAEHLKKQTRTPKYEIFIEISTDRYITKYNTMQYKDPIPPAKYTWLTSSIDRLDLWPRGYVWDCEYASSSTPTWDKMLKRIFKTGDAGYRGILEIQERYRKKKLEERDKRQTDPWDRDMELFPELPKDFMKWAEKEGVPENYIFYEYQRGGAKYGHCSYCSKPVKLKEIPMHGKEGICPKCNKKITYKATGKISILQTNRNAVQILNSIEGGFVIKIFEAYKSYCQEGGYRKPYFGIYESVRLIYRGGKWSRYIWDNYKQRKMRWVKDEWSYSMYRGSGSSVNTVYPHNLETIECDIVRNSTFMLMIRAGYDVDPKCWIDGEIGNPCIEMSAKAGCYELARGLLESCYEIRMIDQNETELTKMLKIDAARLKRIKSMDGGIPHLKWLQEEKRINTIWSEEMIQYFANASIIPKDLEFIHDRMSYVKIYNYVAKKTFSTEQKVNDFLNTWRDYLNMAGKLRMDLKKELIYKPKSLSDAHADVVAMLSQKDMEKQAAAVAKKYKNANKHCKSLKKYEFKDDQFEIIAPTGIVDIFFEGMALRHCIHTCDFYFDRINRKESYLLFLRRASSPKTPWYTLEIEPGGNIRQKRTTGDTQKEDLKEAMPFLKKWQKEIQKRLTAEDKALAKKSDEARKQNYEQIREEKKVVWHGPLAGQLLADVFESDFMEIDIEFDQMPESAVV